MKSKQSQSGFTLLIFLVLLLGLGGVALAGYSQNMYKQVEKKRFEYNKKVLQEAKQALLMYAYNYPAISLTTGPPPARGPGRLPCPDINNTGTPNAVPTCAPATNPPVGRFPWNANGMDFYKARDASGETLWYAVSGAFDFGAGGKVNSDSQGTISIFDQSGSLLYDGSANGVAAVIIAPGPPINGQNRTLPIGSPDDPDDDDPDADPAIIDPVNYLDSFAGFDNASFENSSILNIDGFRLGPVQDVQNTGVIKSYVINDQMVVITTEEVTRMAEKAVLSHYRNALGDYIIDNSGQYPWLFDYDVDTNDDFYDYPTRSPITTNLTNIGRIPTTFSRYFNNDDVIGETIDSELWIQLDYLNETLWLDDVGNFTDTVDVTLAADGSLNYTGSPAYSPADKTFYFWDDYDTPDGILKLCQDDGNGISEFTDCNRDSAGDPTPGSASNDTASIVRKVTMEFNSMPGPGLVTLNLGNMIAAPDCTQADNCIDAGAIQHAYISASFNQAVFNLLVDKIDYEEDEYYLSSFDVTSSGQMSLADGAGEFRVGIRHYPEIEEWVRTNDWHRSIQMAYAAPYRPDGVGAVCSVVGADCLTVTNSTLPVNDKVSLLTIAGSSAIVDGDGHFLNDLDQIFEPEHQDANNIFDKRTGDDVILVLEDI